MWLIGTYKDIHNNTITVKIRNEKNGDNIELGGALVKFAAEDAVTIDCDRDDYFTHIIKKSATIRLVTRIYLGDYLWAANQKSVIVNILRNGKCVFAGYVTPNTYTQDYVEEWTTLDVNCRDLLSTLEDTNLVDKDKYDDFKQNAQTISLKAYLELFGIMNANLNLDNYPQPIFKSNFIWITDGYIYQDGVFYAKLIEVEQVTIDGQVKNIATGNYKRGKVLEPNWILDETKTTTYNGLKYNLEFAYLDIDGNGTYETRTNVSRRTAEPIFDQVYSDTVTYGDVIEQIHLQEYTVITNVTRTYVVDYGIHKVGDVEHLRGMEHCPFELRDEPNVSALKHYVWVYYGNEWHKTNFYEDIGIPDKPVDPNPDIPDPKPDPKPDPDPDQPTPTPSKEYLRFVSIGNSKVSIAQEGTPTDISEGKVIQYKLNDGEWRVWNTSVPISLAYTDKLYLKSDDTKPMSEGYSIYKYFVMTGQIYAYGNIMSLLNFSDTLPDFAFLRLFNNCTSLSSAPELPATKLGEACYYGMFVGCTSLETVHELPATTLKDSCYFDMFNGCTSLTQAPELPATTLAQSCYEGMFYSCKALTQAPVLPATTLVKNCYMNMFGECTSLTQAPVLPATTLADYCYYIMFYGCTGLTTAPALPATTLVPSCYEGMFINCTSLTQAPVLPATMLDPSCYDSMFDGCTKLNYVKALFTNSLDLDRYLTNWLRNVSPTGTFVKNASAAWTKTDAKIPSGWTVEIDGAVTPDPGPVVDKDYLCFTSTGDSTISMTQYGTPDISANKVIQYKLNDGQWQTWNLSAVTLSDGDKMYIKSDDTIPVSEAQNIYKFFVMTGSIAASGNIMSLLNFSDTLPAYALNALFQKCTSLTTAPALTATKLAYSCYAWMFHKCTSLTQAPALPVTTLADYCYEGMFYNCTSLTTAPALPATTLTTYCYTQMFSGCSKLNYVKALFTDISAQFCLSSWLENVSNTGTFVKNANATWTNADAGIPSGWTVQSE